MPHHPVTQIALARTRQEDLLHDAERHRLAAAARREGPGLRERLAALLPRRRQAARVAPAAK